MLKQRLKLQRVAYYTSVSILQLGTLLFILIVSGIYRPLYEPPQVQAVVIPKQKHSNEIIITSGIPVRLHLPSLNINRELLSGEYSPIDGSWTLSPRGIHYATASAPANDYGGSTFIYGHNNKHVFGPLNKLETNDVAELVTDNDLVFVYKLTQRVTLDPTDTSPLTYQDSPRLTLQTCSGNWFQNRDLFYFELVEVRDLYEQNLAVDATSLAQTVLNTPKTINLNENIQIINQNGQLNE